MNIFVLCTGRSGSTTFANAAKHITNFTAAHESRVHLTGEERLAYPPRHIEIDNRLSWLLGRLDRAYGDNARYVHLTRDPEPTAASFQIGSVSASSKPTGPAFFRRRVGATAK